jgi:sugar O-acyltransferase (sialic acid O-acetyltransferase NeuD family)
VTTIERHGLQPLLVVGAGGFARETIEAVHAVNACRPTFRLAGVLDDDERRHGGRLCGVPVLGPSELARDRDAFVVVCVGNPHDWSARRRIVQRLGLEDERYAVVRHPSADLGGSVRLEPGCVVLAGVVATADVRVGAHVSVMPQTVLTHDDTVGSFSILASGVRLGGGVQIGEECYLGAGCLLRQGVRVGRGAQVGMGAVVLEDVPEGEVWAGVPARRLRSVQEGTS